MFWMLKKVEVTENAKPKLNDEEWSSWKMEDEEIDEWSEELIIQVLILMLEASKIKWKLEWLNSELKSTKNRFRMSLLEYASLYSSMEMPESKTKVQKGYTRVWDCILEYTQGREQSGEKEVLYSSM